MSIGHRDFCQSFRTSPKFTLAHFRWAFIWTFTTACFLDSYILVFSRRFYLHTLCFMLDETKEGPFIQSPLLDSSALLVSVLPLPCSANEVSPEFLTLTELGQDLPWGIFRVRSVGPEWPTSLITVISGENLPEDPSSLTLLPVLLWLNLTHTFLSGLCLDMHVPLPAPLILLNLTTCQLGSILNTSSKTENKSTARWSNGE